MTNKIISSKPWFENLPEQPEKRITPEIPRRDPGDTKYIAPAVQTLCDLSAVVARNNAIVLTFTTNGKDMSLVRIAGEVNTLNNIERETGGLYTGMALENGMHILNLMFRYVIR